MNKSMIEVALFPIPNCVVFPGTQFPLHVFEPRYRAMIKHCTETGMLLAVCHVEKEIRRAKNGQTVEEKLNSNQATYKPVKVFSAGRCDLEETFSDGRLRVTLHADVRLQGLEELQSLPFSIYQCRVFRDLPQDVAEDRKAEALKDKLLHRLSALVNHVPELAGMIESPGFKTLNPDVFSFELFKFLRLNPELQQRVLESPSPCERLEIILSLLNKAK